MDRSRKRELQRDSHESVRREILAERAEALSRITRTFERYLARLAKMREQIGGYSGPKRAKHLAAYRETRRRAETWRWYLRVQREVNGLVDGDELDRRYPIPGPIDD